MTTTTFVAIGVAFALGLILGVGVTLFWAQNRFTKPVAPQELSPIMRRIVNAEEAQVRSHIRKLELQRAGRRTQRLDGGPPARVHRMRRRKRINRHVD